MVLRWRVLELECELQITGALKQVSVRQDGQVVRSATVASAWLHTNGRANKATSSTGHSDGLVILGQPLPTLGCEAVRGPTNGRVAAVRIPRSTHRWHYG